MFPLSMIAVVHLLFYVMIMKINNFYNYINLQWVQLITWVVVHYRRRRLPQAHNLHQFEQLVH